MNNAQYFDSPNDVIFLSYFDRLLSKLIGAEKVVMRCDSCKKIPTELIGNKCKNCQLLEDKDVICVERSND